MLWGEVVTTLAIISRAEARVLDELLCDGASNPEIADRLGLSDQTVKCHVKRLLKVTGTSNRTELAVAVLRRRVNVRVQRPDEAPRRAA